MTQDPQTSRLWLFGVGVCILMLALTALIIVAGSDDGPSRDDLNALNHKIDRFDHRFDALTKKLDAASTQIEKMHADLKDLSKQTAAIREAKGAKTGPTATPIVPGVKFHDTFEESTNGWFVARFSPDIIGEVARTQERGQAQKGQTALRLSYTLAPEKLPVVVRMTRGINRLSLWARAVKNPVHLYVGANEGDDSSYDTTIRLEPGQGWKHLSFDFSTFSLGDDSEDENGALDMDQIRSIAIADLGAFLGGTGPNVLLLDEIIGEYRKAKPSAQDGQREKF